MTLRSRYQRTLERIFARPTASDIRWAEVISLMRALDVEISEGSGSRVRFRRDTISAIVHRRHPRPVLSQPAVRTVANFFNDIGVSP
ncbi:MAG: type II toxin-antitoxin system HicA family toxin [Chloroflexi bacterium]|nr:type II toxin-antitoxin system HicA family toxin [Chloroflexota bacterium]